MEKLGVRPGAAVQVLGLADQSWFLDRLRERGADVDADPPYDLVFMRADDHADLDQLPRLKRRIRPAGAIWVVRTKGNSRRLRDTDIIEAAKRADLVDNKIASFSDTLAAMRLVIPVAKRMTES